MRLSIVATLYGVIAATNAAPGNLNISPPSRPDPATLGSPSDTPGGMNIHKGSGFNGNDFEGNGFNGNSNDGPPGSGSTPDPISTALNFYMCCTQSDSSGGIDNFYPPYGCIFAPASGTCPGPTSSFPYLWLCTYQAGSVGNFVSIVL